MRPGREGAGRGGRGRLVETPLERGGDLHVPLPPNILVVIAGMEVSGLSVAVPDPRHETAGYCKASALRVLDAAGDAPPGGPPFLDVPPELAVYRSRGHRRLDARTYESGCASCMWGCKMPVEMTIDQWNPSRKRYRFETFCYGPKSCGLYRAGARRKVPGRKGMSYTEEDWVDEEAVSHCGPDE